MRAGRRVDDRVVVALLDLRVRPPRALSAAVLKEPDLRRARLERRPGARRVEDDLHPLPVGLVHVVELVEVVVEPVLDDELLLAWHAADVGVGDRRRVAVGDQAGEVRRVGAPGAQRIAGEIEVPALPEPGEVGRGRAGERLGVVAGGRDQVDAGVVEDDVDGGRLELLGRVVARQAVGGPQHHDRGVAMDQLAARSGRLGDRGHERQHERDDRRCRCPRAPHPPAGCLRAGRARARRRSSRPASRPRAATR